ncbi:MAG: 30S ribosomal protein S1 [Myxococcota bacterium]|jgi:small subunit ribosomal protein S1|nr:30S ribosomal protein S1 [Myxococcota bacterium]
MSDNLTSRGKPALPSTADFESLLEESYHRSSSQVGEIVKGRVIAVNKDHIVVDVGAKSEGQIPLDEFPSLRDMNLKPGDVIDVLLESQENDDGLVELSKEKADRLKIWEDISEACIKDELVKGVIVSRVKGGLSVDIGVKAFLPGSQVDIRPVRNLDKYLGESYDFKVIKFNKKRGNIVLSRRALLEKERAKLKAKTLEVLEEGGEMIGTIKNITEYGAFVDLGGIDGLLHITDMSWGRVNHPSELYQVGDEVKVKVLKFNPDTDRVSLGVKQLSEDPWTHADRRYPVSSRVFGKVVSLTDYGAFVELEEGIEGLVHISEMSWTKRVKHPSKMVAIGDEVECVVLDVDVRNKRISLGMKQVEPNPWTLLQDKYPLGSTIRGKVRNITEFGVFVGIEEGIDGLVHISDLSWTYRVKHPADLFQKGEEVEAVVLNIDVENERFSLGIKQLYPDPWGHLPRTYPLGREVGGRVTKVVPLAAVVELEPGVEGLLPVEEIAEGLEDATTKLHIGENLSSQVLVMDSRERRVVLSVRALVEAASGDAAYSDGSSRATLGDLLKSRFGGLATASVESSEAADDEEAEPAAEE